MMIENIKFYKYKNFILNYIKKKNKKKILVEVYLFYSKFTCIIAIFIILIVITIAIIIIIF